MPHPAQQPPGHTGWTSHHAPGVAKPSPGQLPSHHEVGDSATVVCLDGNSRVALGSPALADPDRPAGGGQERAGPDPAGRRGGRHPGVSSAQRHTRMRDLLGPRLRSFLMVGLVLAFLQQALGINAVIYFGATVLNFMGPRHRRGRVRSDQPRHRQLRLRRPRRAAGGLGRA
jgi:hypothetical protein